jgi:hypothetical protein
VALAGVLLLCGAGAGQLLRASNEGNDVDKRAKLELQYAQAQFDLAETNLKKIEATNQRFSKTISAAVIADYVEDLAIAKAQLESAKQGNDPDLFTVWLRRAESNLRSAESYYKSATAANQRQPGTVDPFDLKRLKLRVDITRLQYKRGRLLAGAEADQKLQWQVQILNDEVARLKEQTSRIAPQTRVYPWRY